MHPAESNPAACDGVRGILCVGSILVDIVCPVPGLPKAGQGMVLEKQHRMVAGCSFNTANIVRQMGADVRLFAPVGCGANGAFVDEQLSKLGMEGYHPSLPAGIDSGCALCLTDPSGERTMLTLPGIERHFQDEWFSECDTSGMGYLEICGFEVDGAGGDAIISFAEQHPHLQLYFAPGPCVGVIARGKMARIQALHPIWHLNESEALEYTGLSALMDAGRKLAEEAGNAVIVTQGAEGAHAFLPGGAGEGPAHFFEPTQPIKPVDTIGAGDAHIGAVMAMRAQGAGWQEALRVANCVSAAVCSVQGASLTDAQFAEKLGDILR